MKTFKTPKGTELPLRDMKGKDYLDVPYRVQWMREEHDDWGIETSFLQLTEKVAIAHATIRDGAGRVLAQATKTETPGGFADYVEKAETGSVGRALAFCGYGTQFAQELVDEDENKVVDAPKEGRPHLPSDSEFASEAQVKRLTAIQLKAKVPDPVLKSMAAGLGISSRNEIPKSKYNSLCTLVENYKA